MGQGAAARRARLDHLIVDFAVAMLRYSGPAVPVALRSPAPCRSEPTPLRVGRRTAITFPENIGHVAGGGRDGWGRAFSQGVLCALAGGYDFAVHVEGGLLTRLDLQDICGMMMARASWRWGPLPRNGAGSSSA